MDRAVLVGETFYAPSNSVLLKNTSAERSITDPLGMMLKGARVNEQMLPTGIRGAMWTTDDLMETVTGTDGSIKFFALRTNTQEQKMPQTQTASRPAARGKIGKSS